MIGPRSIINLVDGGVGTLHECVGTNKGSVALEGKICLKKIEVLSISTYRQPGFVLVVFH